MIAAAVHGIVAQRLLRRVVRELRASAAAGPAPGGLAEGPVRPRGAAASFSAGSGCTYCNLTGYRGRIAVYELLELDRTLTEAIQRGDLGRFEEAARTRANFASLAQGALDLAIRGVTTVSEALSVITGADTDDGSSTSARAADPLLEEALQADAMGAGK